MEKRSLKRNIIIWLILGAIILALPASTVVSSAMKEHRIEEMVQTRETVAKQVGKYIKKGITGYNDISGVKVTTDFSTKDLKKKDYDEWNDMIIVTCTPKKGFSKLTNYEKLQYMMEISEYVEHNYYKYAKKVSEDYSTDIIKSDGWTTMEDYECRLNTYVDVYCVTSKHTYYYNDNFTQDDFYKDHSYSRFYVDGKQKNADPPGPSSSSSKSSSSTSSASGKKKSSGSSSKKTYNSYSYDPADYDDPDEFAEDAEDEYGSYDAAYDAWEDY